MRVLEQQCIRTSGFVVGEHVLTINRGLQSMPSKFGTARSFEAFDQQWTESLLNDSQDPSPANEKKCCADVSLQILILDRFSAADFCKDARTGATFFL